MTNVLVNLQERVAIIKDPSILVILVKDPIRGEKTIRVSLKD